MDSWPAVVFVFVVAVAVWVVLRKPPVVFVVRIRDGVPQAAKGKVTTAFLAAMAEVCRDFAVSSGEVRGVRRRGRISLWFSSSIPPAAGQRLRNWWSTSGWH